MTKRRILLADDDPQVRSSLQAILMARDYLVDQASDGVEALDIVKASGSTVDLVITDVKMPRMDGVALARAVAEMFPTMPVLFISGWSDPLEGLEWQKPGYGFLRKPFLPKALVDRIEELLARTTGTAAVPHSPAEQPLG